MNCQDCILENPGGYAINARSVFVGTTVFLRQGFKSSAKASFYRADIRGDMRCVEASFDNSAGEALNLSLAEIGGALFFDRLPKLDGALILEQATCRLYHDDEASWPAPGKLRLDGFTYSRFYACRTDWEFRREWLRRQPPEEFPTQPWSMQEKSARNGP